MDRTEVTVAFELVLDEIESVIGAVGQRATEVLKQGRPGEIEKYEEAKDLIEKASQMATLRQRVKELQAEWTNVFVPVIAPKKRRRRSKQTRERLKKGLRTPEDAFRVPLLQALVQLGGSGPVADVLDRVGVSMKSELNVYDRECLASTANQARWRNTAQWARNAMVRENLMSSNSPHGLWEITEQGRRSLTNNSVK